MIEKICAMRYCKDDITKIENYEKAIADNTQTWQCHHRLETHKYKDRNRKEWVKRDEDVSVETLIAFDVYYNRPAEELIFMTHAEHRALHCKGKKRKPFSDEWKRKISEAKKGTPAWNKGKTGIYSEETRKKISEANKRRSCPNKGKHWKLVDGKHVYY